MLKETALEGFDASCAVTDGDDDCETRDRSSFDDIASFIPWVIAALIEAEICGL